VDEQGRGFDSWQEQQLNFFAIVFRPHLGPLRLLVELLLGTFSGRMKLTTHIILVPEHKKD
jgi:hypothetical protein